MVYYLFKWLIKAWEWFSILCLTVWQMSKCRPKFGLRAPLSVAEILYKNKSASQIFKSILLQIWGSNILKVRKCVSQRLWHSGIWNRKFCNLKLKKLNCWNFEQKTTLSRWSFATMQLCHVEIWEHWKSQTLKCCKRRAPNKNENLSHYVWELSIMGSISSCKHEMLFGNTW